MSRKPLKYNPETVEEKLKKINSPVEEKKEEEKSEEKVEDKIDKIISSKAQAIKEFDLTHVTKGVKVSLQKKSDQYLETISEINSRSKQDQATQYVLEGLKRDHARIIQHLKNLIE